MDKIFSQFLWVGIKFKNFNKIFWSFWPNFHSQFNISIENQSKYLTKIVSGKKDGNCNSVKRKCVHGDNRDHQYCPLGDYVTTANETKTFEVDESGTVKVFAGAPCLRNDHCKMGFCKRKNTKSKYSCSAVENDASCANDKGCKSGHCNSDSVCVSIELK